MSRPICVLTITFIVIIIGLHLNGVVFLDFNKIYTYINDNTEYEGIIIEEKEEKKYRYEYVIKLKSQDKVINNKKFILSIKKKNNKKLNYGDKIKFNGTYIKPDGQRNYGGFDYSLYLKTKKIYGTFEANNVKVISNNTTGKINQIIYRIRKYIKNILEEKLGKDEAFLAIGIIIGEKINIPDKIKEDFKNANLAHMIAISGTHFSYVILIMTYINNIIKRKRLGQFLTITVIILFMYITGNTASVIRAGVMAIMVIIASILHKRQDVWNNIAISLLIQIVNNPYIIFDIGLQLSYGVVIGILTFYKNISKIIIKNKKNKMGIYILNTIIITISANIVIIPITLFHFNTISLSFIISNLVASPILGLIIIIAFMLICASTILKSLINPFWKILDILLKIFIKITNICANLPLSKIYVVTPKIILIILFYFVILLINKITIKSNYKLAKSYLIGSLVIVILLNFAVPILTSKRNNLEINFIDVGQGDSTLIRVNNKNILVDGGGSLDSSSFDIGEKVLFPYLLDRGVYGIDYIIVSHFDADHCQGIEYVMKNMKVKNAIISGLGQESNEYNMFISLAKKQNIKIIHVKKGDIIRIKDAIIKILYPDNEAVEENPKNNNAIVCKIEWQDSSILFTGDIEKEAEMKILKMYESNIEVLKSSILKVAHHGSKTSSTEEFIRAVDPKVALIGVGKNNKFGHPNSGILERLEGIGCKICRTDKRGEITIKIDKRIQIESMI